MSRFLRSENVFGDPIVVDLEHVHTYYKNSGGVAVCGWHHYTVKMTFEDFDKAFMAYQASKIFQGYPGIPIMPPTPPIDPLTPSEPYEPKDRYAPTTTTGELIWKGTSDTTTTVRFSKAPKAKKGKKK